MRIHYVSGSRADFGLMRRSLQAIRDADGLSLQLILTGQALLERYGSVESETTAAGLEIACRVPVQLEGGDRSEMAKAFAVEVAGISEFWTRSPPDLALVLGDRGEMLAATVSAFNLAIPVAHIHGGERSGSIDDGFRHSISKLATYHLVANADSLQRLLNMGEERERIVQVGAPGLVGLTDGLEPDRNWLSSHFGIDADRPVALVLFHPVVTEGDVGAQFEAVLSAAAAAGYQSILLRPNSDSGAAQIDEVIDCHAAKGALRALAHLDRASFVKAVASCDVMLGNSSAGIIESASLGTPCVNVGTRQDGRLRNENIVDCVEVETENIVAALISASRLEGPFGNVYGDGGADEKIVAALRKFAANPAPLQKRLTY
ncbi:UDP-N-acetylglucosamine 2-epimerase [Altererythrobacter sp. MF3-039]|uniref:UDP-N-acetylglucosamine 2-epimerase n=1 Tax=Altererythrobacter sp. MF3-039 TaxID=3252901 RepID=UPI00390CA2ED